MSPSLQRSTSLPVIAFCVLLGTVYSEPVLAGEVPCDFRATETTEVHVLADGKTLWAGSIEKAQTKTVTVPEGPFTVISKIYNQNLKAKEDVRAEAHTRQCRSGAALGVPLFQDTQER